MATREDGISIIAGAMNRTEPLRYSLASWLDSPANQIIIVDWSSEQPIKQAVEEMDLPYYDAEKVVHVRVDGEQHWKPGSCWNLAARFVTQTRIAKFDSDVCWCRPDLIETLPSKEYFSNHWNDAARQNEAYLTGSWFGWTSDFISIGGYDERFDSSYGYEDDDLYRRLSTIAKRNEFPQGSIYHLPHSESKRFSQMEVPKQGVETAAIAYHGQRELWSAQMARQRANEFVIEQIDMTTWSARIASHEKA